MSGIAKNVYTAIKKRSPEILTGIGIAGMITTTVMAVKATPKALSLIAEQQHEEVDGYLAFVTLTPLETIKTAWKCYIPAAAVGCASVACLIGASSVNTRRNAALATAYTLSESVLKGYREKVIETIGDKKEQGIRDAISKEKLEQNPVTKREVILTEKGNTLCYDVISGRYFKSDIEKIKKAVNDVNKMLIDDMSASLNDFYYELGLSSTKMGEDLGWRVDKGLIDIHFSSQLAEDGTPCLVLDYTIAPIYNYF